MKNRKFIPGLTILLLGSTTFLVQMTFSSKLPQYTGIITSFVLLSLALLFFIKDRENTYGKIFYLFFVASASIMVSSHASHWALSFFNISTDNYKGFALAKFAESVPVILIIIVLTRFAVTKHNDLYLKSGKIWKGLLTGISFFTGFTILALFTGDQIPLFNENLQNSNPGELSILIPWVLIFVFSNGFMEELLFRGLFLKFFESIIGFRFSNILTALIFSIAHMQVTYSSSMVVFLIVVFFLGLLLGDVMKKTDSIIAPTIIHAGADVMLILPMFAGLME